MSERTPLVLVHGFTDIPRTWDLVLPALARAHDVLVVALPGHVGGPPLPPSPLTGEELADHVWSAMRERGWSSAHVVGNSLGGYVALQLAARGVARSVVALAPAGGWAPGDESYRDTLEHFVEMQAAVRGAVAHADAIAATPEGRRRATAFITERWEHLPADLVADQIRGVAGCDGAPPLIDLALRQGWVLDPAPVTCPLRIVWGTADRLLPWPTAAARYRSWFPTADWVELDDVGHCPQLDVPLETAQLILGWTA